MVSSSDSFFLVAELAKSTLIILALVRFPVITRMQNAVMLINAQLR
jgi:hypothetical protein